jgi:hypothetical protein
MVLETGSLWHGAYSQESQDLYDRIMELRAEGLGYRRIAKRLNNEGVKTPRGKLWLPQSVFSLIKKRRIRDERLTAPPTIRYQNSGIFFLERRHIKKWSGGDEHSLPPH